MNKVYKIIWSRTKNCYVVASEFAKGHTKSSNNKNAIAKVGLSLAVTLAALNTFGTTDVLAVAASATADTYGATGKYSGDGTDKGTAIGTSTTITKGDGTTTAIGAQSEAYGLSAVAIGGGKSGAASAEDAIGNVAIGYSIANGGGAVGIGYNTNASNTGAVAIGNTTKASGVNAIALAGGNANGANAIALAGGKANGLSSMAFGSGAAASSKNIAFGENANATSTQTLAVGTNTKAGMKYSVAIGSDARTVNADGTVTGGGQSSGAIAIGYQASATNNEAIAIGGGTKGNGYAIASGAQSIALGGRTQTSGSQSIGIGGDVKVYGNASIGIGGDDIEDALNATVTTSMGRV